MSSPPLMSVLGGSSSSDFTSTSTSSPTTHHSSSYSNLSPSILIIILILSITIIASVFLCYLLRHLNRRCLRHLSPSSTAVSANESNHFSSRRISPETPNPAFTVVDSLPLFAFSAITRRSTSAASVVAGDCAVCLSKFEPDDQLRLLPLCCHAFHSLCVDTWLRSNQTCPLCRSPLIASDAELFKAFGGDQIGNSFRLEIGNISQRQTTSDYSGETRRSYSIGSFDYLVDEDSEVFLNKEDNRPPPAAALPVAAPEPSLAAEVASGRSWLKDYVDRLSMSLSSRAHSFRSSGRFFSGSSRRSEVPAGVIGDWDLEACRVGEEISEMFRWASGV